MVPLCTCTLLRATFTVAATIASLLTTLGIATIATPIPMAVATLLLLRTTRIVLAVGNNKAYAWRSLWTKEGLPTR